MVNRRRVSGWRDISLITTPKGEGKTHGCVNAFHEKAGRSQVDSFPFSLNTVFPPTE